MKSVTSDLVAASGLAEFWVLLFICDNNTRACETGEFKTHFTICDSADEFLHPSGSLPGRESLSK